MGIVNLLEGLRWRSPEVAKCRRHRPKRLIWNSAVGGCKDNKGLDDKVSGVCHALFP
jgi:hypothetical protein